MTQLNSKESYMSDRSTDASEQTYQRDQAEGERDDAMEQRVTRGPHGDGGDETRQQTPADRDQAEGSRAEADK